MVETVGTGRRGGGRYWARECRERMKGEKEDELTKANANSVWGMNRASEVRSRLWMRLFCKPVFRRLLSPFARRE